MIGVVCLDAGPLGLATHYKSTGPAADCRRWVESLAAREIGVVVPEIADYEVRRELLRAGKSESVARLDAFCEAHDYLPLTTSAMRQAAEFWAETRQRGRPTASDAALDADVILAGQAATLGVPLSQIMVATTNPGHLTRFVPAKLWKEITLEGQ